MEDMILSFINIYTYIRERDMGVNFNFQYYALEPESLNLIYKRENTIEEKN